MSYKSQLFSFLFSNREENNWPSCKSKNIAARSYCLSFYYHMFGSPMGDLTVFTQNGSQPMETKWTENTNRGDIWIQNLGIDLKLDPQTKVHPLHIHIYRER